MTGVARMAELVMSEQSIQSVLDLVVELTRTAIEDADAVAITLKQHERLTTVAVSSPALKALADVEPKHGGGPGTQAMKDRETIVLGDVSADERWPRFAHTAAQEGFKSVIAIPMIPVSEPIGVLLIYSASVRETDDRPVRLAELLARQAAVAIANSDALLDGAEANDQLREALDSRDIIGQAKGILMERSNLDSDEAFDQMRVESQRDNRKLRDVAEDIVRKVLKRGRS